MVLADKAYSIVKIRDYLEKQAALVCIPDKVNAKVNMTLTGSYTRNAMSLKDFSVG